MHDENDSDVGAKLMDLGRDLTADDKDVRNKCFFFGMLCGGGWKLQET